MSKSLHERATEILGQVLDLPTAEAYSRIERECADNELLKKEVLSLYSEIVTDDSGQPDMSSSHTSAHSRRIGDGKKHLKTTIIGDWTKKIFGVKKYRLIFIIINLAVIVGLGLLVRAMMRTVILDSKREEKIALINTNSEILKRWIDVEKKRVQAITQITEVIHYSRLLDSLSQLDNDYSFIKNSDISKEATRFLLKVESWGNFASVNLLSKDAPKFLLSTVVLDDKGISQFTGAYFGSYLYDEYLMIQSGETIFIPPVHDQEGIYELPDTIKGDVACGFASVVRGPDQEPLAVLIVTYLARNEFSDLFKISQYGISSETYAFDEEARMISSSRFTDDLRKTYLLDYDSTLGTIYNIQLNDPGGDVLKGYTSDVPSVQLSYTKIVQEAFGHLEKEDFIFTGAVMDPYRDYRGIEVVGAWTWFPDLNIGIITEEDAEEALLPLRYLDYSFLFFYILIFFLSFLLYNSNIRIASFGKRIEKITKLGQYKLLEKLGEGGFGEVYRAEHAFLKTPVAIKILKSEMVTTDVLNRFEKEVKITSSLSHPNTIKVYDYGSTDNGQFYYVMEYLNGIALEKLLNIEKQINVNRGIYILLHICLSLQEAHNRGLIHRDIKPMNIMLCNQGGAYDVVKVLDFGLVKNVDASFSQQTQINKIGGTPMFMAPERIRDPFHNDQRVDIYSLGALGLYMFSGQYVVELISQKVIGGQQTLRANFKDQIFDRQDVPEDLKKLLFKCIHFDPENRPNNIEELTEVLESLNNVYPWTRKDSEKWWKAYDVYG